MHAQTKMDYLSPDAVLSLQLSSMVGSRNVLTVMSDGLALFQPERSDFSRPPECFQMNLFDKTETDINVEEFLQDKLPASHFFELGDHFYRIPSDASCGTAANLNLRMKAGENWLGIWNYGRDDGLIPIEVDGGMYRAVLALADDLEATGKATLISMKEMNGIINSMSGSSDIN